jgi:thiamine pyrophosphokinase
MIDFIIFTDENIFFPLNSGMNKIFVPDIIFTRRGVGLLPMEKSIISTKGLKWDVNNWETSFGKNISTSNEFENDEIDIYVENGCMMLSAEIDTDNIPFL